MAASSSTSSSASSTSGSSTGSDCSNTLSTLTSNTQAVLTDLGSKQATQDQLTKIHKQLLLNQVYMTECLKNLLKQQMIITNVVMALKASSEITSSASTLKSSVCNTQQAQHQLLLTELLLSKMKDFFTLWILKTKGTSLIDGHIAAFEIINGGGTVWSPALIYGLVT